LRGTGNFSGRRVRAQKNHLYRVNEKSEDQLWQRSGKNALGDLRRETSSLLSSLGTREKNVNWDKKSYLEQGEGSRIRILLSVKERGVTWKKRFNSGGKKP